MIQIGKAHEHGFDEPLGLLSDCHRRIEMFLGVLVRVAEEFDGRGLTAEGVDAVRRAREYFAKAAPRHTQDEEESLFPRMREAAAKRGERCEAIERLEGDHTRAGVLHERVDGLLDEWMRNGTLEAEKAAVLRQMLRELQGIYVEHIREEDEKVFPHAARLLTAKELAQVGEEMRARRGV